ncbi:putative serine/threonine-protein kinase [Streptomyces ambofaciens ATCC 23877]|uniref:Putative serine/threonine-protein kinase n=1 Tax=Streptomyces ambofaciens (strain ATCC 23877 / 3486 / DSM 40053 / JCM 4204 / NBRC 12836 / NRRL B-2516) TaxID=278992 RepID=Q1RQY6_STRA7|nr:putative serine/threonine-protein kinase [Streptomyces ambofaciens ATCC 23877]AKZ60587.1 putative serine/threonine-protein kinase [Streptomyces ambofaciens ATCC 23877]CAI78029.1 putative serine/threonine-protein kinase [Streptomyces ambofaciens ATCC 23877]CAI78303.1 putative serine/threonine-protein kinase [Streptomyces ambofaciens ATCC 23877]CAJ87808.1 putative serine/threonine-protein kinase [Streptomyces ambofaciens ATCC 23877]
MTGTPLAEAKALYEAGRYAEAEAEARAVARSRPQDDEYAAAALNIAAIATGAQGRHAEALDTYDEALPVSSRIFGADHFLTLKLRSDRAQAMTALGRHAECEAECAAVAEMAGRGTGPDMARLAGAARNGLVFALNAQERHQEAETLARQALAAHRERDRLPLVLRLGLARSLNGQARCEDALTEAQGAGELYRALPADQRHPDTGAVEVALATALLGLHRTPEARGRAAAAHDACLASFGPDHRRTAEARTLLEHIDGTRP